MILDCDRIRRRRVELNLSHRTVASALGTASGVVTGIERGTNHNELSVSQLRRLADLLTVEITDLFTTSEASTEPEPDDDDDAATLGKLLATTAVLTPVSALVEATGWPLQRTRSALDVLAERLAGTGQRLHRLNGQAGIVSRAAAADVKPTKAILRSHLARDGVSVSEARMMRRIETGQMPKLLGNADSVAVGVLANAQLIDADEKGTWRLTDDVRYSLLLEPTASGRVPGRD